MFARVLKPTLLVLVAGCTATPDPEPGVLRVAACQILVDGDREAAFARIDSALAQAARSGAQIACFPETSLFGWVNPRAHRLADPIPGATTERLGELARRHQLMFAIGLAELDGDKLYDAAVLFDSDGELLAQHRKVNVLAELMQPPYTPGASESVAVTDTRLGRIGLLICADTFVDEVVARVAAGEPDLVLVPYGWAAPPEAWPAHGDSLHAWIASTARRTSAPVVGVDAVGVLGHGPWSGYELGGQSAASDAAGRLSEPLADRIPQVRVFEFARGASPR